MRLYRYPERYAIVRLSLGAAGTLPAPGREGFFVCVRDKNEVTLVVPDSHVPAGAACVERGFRAVMLDTCFALETVGVLARCSRALADAGIPVMAYSSHTTDVFLVRDEHFERACTVLEALPQ